MKVSMNKSEKGNLTTFPMYRSKRINRGQILPAIPPTCSLPSKRLPTQINHSTARVDGRVRRGRKGMYGRGREGFCVQCWCCAGISVRGADGDSLFPGAGERDCGG